MSFLHPLLRLGVAACFIGHGMFGILGKQDWLPFFSVVGIGPEAAYFLMPLVGVVDVAVGVAVLFRPFRALLAYAVAWCLWTAALRPITGLGVWELVERAGNYGVPLAFLVLVGTGGPGRAWFERIRSGITAPGGIGRAFVVLQWTTALLLIGHGLLAFSGKALLAEHLAAAGIGSRFLPFQGALELGLAAIIIIRPHPLVFVYTALWKLGTESLFLAAGSPVWEVVERGGSYVAPLAAALIMASPEFARVAARPRAAFVTAGLAVLLLVDLGGIPGPPSVEAHPAPPPVMEVVQDTSPSTLAARLRDGGYVLACRHAVTDRSRGDRRPVDLDDPSTQRVLSERGIGQARDIGREIRRLGIRFDEVLASPYDRTLRSAELTFGSARKEPLLSYSGWSSQAGMELFTRAPTAGSNRALMTHQGILYRALPVPRGSIAEGECVVVKPGPEPEPLGSLELEDWRAAG